MTPPRSPFLMDKYGSLIFHIVDSEKYVPAGPAIPNIESGGALLMSEKPRYCHWRRDTELETITGYMMDCVKPVGSTRIMSGNIGGFNFSPYCGGKLAIVPT